MLLSIMYYVYITKKHNQCPITVIIHVFPYTDPGEGGGGPDLLSKFFFFKFTYM